MVRGGAAEADRADAARARDLRARSARDLRERGLLFVGIDVIDGYLTEINVTSPTGIRASASASAAPDIAARDLGRDRGQAG